MKPSRKQRAAIEEAHKVVAKLRAQATGQKLSQRMKKLTAEWSQLHENMPPLVAKLRAGSLAEHEQRQLRTAQDRLIALARDIVAEDFEHSALDFRRPSKRPVQKTLYTTNGHVREVAGGLPFSSRRK